MKDLFSKYDIPAPRYTSYPTVPYWETTPTREQWIQHLRQTLQTAGTSWSMYIHIPYCETLCTFCGCNTTITKDHSKGMPYVEAVLNEWKAYLEAVPELAQKPMKQIHLGGGSPTFLTPKELESLIQGLFSIIKKDEHEFEAGIEVDPRRTTVEQLEVLRKYGFNRISLGVQDFNPEVQRLVNRIQPYDITEKITTESRRLGYESVNFDLIYGLAGQTAESIKNTAELTVKLRPDRIALYSFALVPWIKPQQRLFKDEDLPKAEEKRNLYEIARGILLKAGYLEVGMDHFAWPTDGLAKKMKTQELHRNFMGYTDSRTDVLLGLGVSSISETPYSFHQNEKVIHQYMNLVSQNQIPSFRGHVLTEEDRLHREQILKLMTRSEVDFLNSEQAQEAKTYLSEMANDGLVKITDQKLVVTEKGKPFLRNACLFFDARLRQKWPQTRIFSQSI
jgi:oxygen-independent coproporphyrinogen-3 oxidase